MMRLSRPMVFLALLVPLVALGAVLLAQPFCTPQTGRDVEYFWAYHYWQCAFDSLSAACGVGLLSKSFDSDYTDAGRWVLTGIGVCGAVLFIASACASLRLVNSSLGAKSTPTAGLVVCAFLSLQVLAIVIVLFARLFSESDVGLGDSTLAAIATFASLGFVREHAVDNGAWLFAVLAWLSAIGWPLWLLAIPRFRRTHVQVKQAIVVGLSYTLLLVFAGALVAGFETPRGGRGPTSASTELSDQSGPVRFARGLTQAACAAGTGVQTETLADRRASEGTKLTLAAVVLVGGSGYGAGGGITWTLLLWALAGLIVGRRRTDAANDMTRRWLSAGLSAVVALGLAAVTVAAGLLLIETLTASRFTPAPTLADALLDACSAVGGGAITSGLTETVTSKNLASGIRMPIDMYQVGMAWLMLAMLIGRIIPLVVLRRIGSDPTPDPAR